MNKHDLDSENTDRGPKLDHLQRGSTAAPADEGSSVSDLLYILGIRKKVAAGSDPSANQPPSAKTLDDASSPELFPPPAGDLFVSDEFAEPEQPEESGETPFLSADVSKPESKVKFIKIVWILAAALLVSFVVFFALPYLTEPTPPGENVVASYNGKNIMIEDLKSFILLEQAKEEEHLYCDVHGYDHTKCTADEACESHPVDSIEGYRQMLTNLAVEQIIQQWAASNKVTQREDVQHGLKDLLDNASVQQLIEQIHTEEITPESISSWEVQQYYDENKDTYSGKSLTDVEDEIRQTLVSQKDEDYLSNYIEKLKQTAGLKVNFDLLKVTAPTDEEIVSFYESQKASIYKTAETASVLEIRVVSGDTKNKADEAIRKIRSGESFDSVAATYGMNNQASELSFEKGSGAADLEAIIWSMKPGDISDPIANADGSFTIAKLIKTTPAGGKPLSDVKADIRKVLQQKNMEEEYSLRRDEALFSVHSRRYTLGDFYTEFKELSSEYQAQFSTFEQKQQLVEQLIAKELLLEETGDQSADPTKQHSYEELKIQYLGQILHQQEVDKKLTDPTDDEIRKFYNDNKKSFMVPAGVRVSLVWIDQGLNGEKTEQARQKAEEALSLLGGGTDFAEVAKKYSEDGTAEAGGEVQGLLYQDQLPDTLGKAIFSLQSGETSGILDHGYGFYIVKVNERTDERVMSYEESSEDIRAHLKEEKHSKLESEMEQVLLSNANFIIYDKTLRNMLREQQTP